MMTWTPFTTVCRVDGRDIGLVERVERYDHLWEITETKWSATWFGGHYKRTGIGKDFDSEGEAKDFVEKTETDARAREKVSA